MPSLEAIPQSLEAKVLDRLCRERRLAYAEISPDLTVRQTSPLFHTFMNDPVKDPVGLPIADLFWELVGGEKGLMEVLRGESSAFRIDNINREDQDGSTSYLSLIIQPLDSEEPRQGLLLILEDSTLQGQLEQALVQERNELRLTRGRLSRANDELKHLNQLKSLFLSIAAHDMRAPLTAMRGYTDLAQMVLQESVNPQADEYLSIVGSQVDTLNRLITDFLDLDVIEQGRFKIRPDSCDLNAIAEEVARAMLETANRNQVSLVTAFHADPPTILADPERIRQVLFNLLANAIKYTGAGDQVILSTSRKDRYGVIEVTDHGPGIPAEELAHLFDLYHRTSSARMSKVGGLGLGLFIVKSIIDAHAGRVEVSSEIGRGTTFQVQIPLYLASAESESE